MERHVFRDMGSDTRLCVNDFLKNHFFRLGFGGVHDADPFHRISSLERFGSSCCLGSGRDDGFQPALRGILDLGQMLKERAVLDHDAEQN